MKNNIKMDFHMRQISPLLLAGSYYFFSLSNLDTLAGFVIFDNYFMNLEISSFVSSIDHFVGLLFVCFFNIVKYPFLFTYREFTGF